jgi:type IX secretion system PorP/SprF family membrane protein
MAGKSRYFVLLLISSLFGVSIAYSQQEPMYSQYMFNMMNVNPAYAGFRGSSNLTLTYRYQWAGIEGAPKTGTMSWDNLLENSNVGLGAQLYNDQLGVEKTSGFQGIFSYHVPFENSYLALGLSAGLLNFRADYSDLKTIEPNDPVLQNYVNGWLPTAGFGAMYITDDWYVAFSIPALLHTKIDVANYLNQKSFGASNHYFLTGGYIFDLQNGIKLKPSMMIKAVKGSPLQFDFNLNAWFNETIAVGLSYRLQDAIVAQFQFQVSDQIRVGYAYDYTISGLSNFSKGTHEILLRYTLPSKNTCENCKKKSAFE